jgi:Dyp-type peroxidase family
MGNHSQSTGTQPAILQETGSHGLFVVFDVKSGRPGVAKAAARAAADLPALVNSLGASLGNAGLAATIAFGSEFWDQLETGKKPKHLRKQKPVQGAPGIVPSTGGDLFLHIKSDRHDVNWDLAHKFKDTLPPETVVMDETEGFTYKDNRDLTGFIDGTANPKGHEWRVARNGRSSAILCRGGKRPEIPASSFAPTPKTRASLKSSSNGCMESRATV